MKCNNTICILFFTLVLSVAPLYSEGAAEEVTVKISTLRGPTGIGMIKMLDEEPSLGEGVAAEYEISGAPDVVVSKVLSGETDIASLPTNVAAKLYNKGVPYRLGAVTGYGVLYIVGSDNSLTELEQLKGKTLFNIGKAATPDYIVRYILEENGIDTQNDMEIRFQYSHPELAQSLIAGRVDLGVLPEPFSTKVVQNTQDVSILFDIQQEWAKLQKTEDSIPMSCVIISNELVETSPGIVERFFTTYRDSIAWVNENPEMAGILAEKHNIGLDAKTAEAAIPRLNLKFKSASEARREIEGFLKVFLSFEPQSIGGNLPEDDFYYNLQSE